MYLWNKGTQLIPKQNDLLNQHVIWINIQAEQVWGHVPMKSYPRSKIFIGNTELKNFTEFCYLSSTLTMNKRQKYFKDQHVFGVSSNQVSILEAR